MSRQRPWLVWPVRPLLQRTFATEAAARRFVCGSKIRGYQQAIVIKVKRKAMT